MNFISTILILLCPILTYSQTQTKSQCVATLRARSMSLSSADAEKICSEDSADIGNCAITKMQGSHRGGMAEAVKACRSESNWYASTPTPTPKSTASPAPTPTPSPTVSPTPTEEEKEPKKSDDKKSDKKGTFEEL